MMAWRKMLLSVALLSSVIIYALAIEPYWIKTSIHTIGHPSVIAPTRVVQLSDLHLQTFDVRHEKVAPFLRVRIPPGDFAPAGSNRSSHGGNEVAEAFGVEGHLVTWRVCRPQRE